MKGYVNDPHKCLQNIKTIIDRYKTYEKFLKYPGDWGERALRGWLAFEFFQNHLGWDSHRIVLGEIFDVLFINDQTKPVLYLETKKPLKGLVGYDAFINRSKSYPSLRIGLLTDGISWLSYDYLVKEKIYITINDEISKWGQFLEPLHKLNFIYGDY